MNEFHASHEMEEGEIPSVNESTRPRNKMGEVFQLINILKSFSILTFKG